MGSSPVIGSGGSSSSSCCDMSLKCWCRWRWDHCFFSTTFLFFLASFLVLGSLASLFAWLTFSPYERLSLSSLGCQEDNEGSWAIGIFYGQSPFNLKPIESKFFWKDESAAWPVANPVITCATSSDAGFPSNFVADPFLFVEAYVEGFGLHFLSFEIHLSVSQSSLLRRTCASGPQIGCNLVGLAVPFRRSDWDDVLYLFFETKNSITLQGDIGVARSNDKGVTWQHLGIALNEEWHLSYPFVFRYLDQIYMMPESSQKGDLRLYRALNFPLQWTLDRVILKKPLIDSFIINHGGNYWLFGSDFSGFGTKKNGELEIWHSTSPLGPWKPHKQNPIYNIDRSLGARNGGRPFVYYGDLYRVGQDCGETYGRRVRVFKVEVLSKDEYKEVEVQLGMDEPEKGRNSWNGARYHHLDAQQLRSGEWVAVMDGDRVPSGDPFHRFMLGSSLLAAVVLLVVFVGLLVGTVKCILPLNWCLSGLGKRSDSLTAWERDRSMLLSSKLRRLYSRLHRLSSSVRGRMKLKLNTCAGGSVLALFFIIGVVLMCKGVGYIYGGNGAEEAYPFKGQYSQFTLLTMTYEARLWNLKMYVKHYSRCSSVGEIVVVWNKGQPPELSDLDSVVPIRIRVEEKNSLNNRFKIDPLIKTRGVLELDDDIMMTCDDVERGFRVWREHPDRIVGFYPRLIDGSPLKYRDERYARTRRGYNMILTGAAFIDSKLAFKRYWSDEARKGRELVDKYFNCEDVLLNFLYANGSSSRTVEYVKPAWAIDTSKFSGVAISRNTQVHYQIRSNCLVKFSEIYGNLASRKWEFDGRGDGWDV